MTAREFGATALNKQDLLAIAQGVHGHRDERRRCSLNTLVPVRAPLGTAP